MLNFKIFIIMKFKLIEKDRFLKMKEMAEVKGGLTCMPADPYNSCSAPLIRYSSCKVSVMNGPIFQQDPCGDNIYTICSGMTYTSCSRVTPDYVICPGNYKGTFNE